ncbi:MAG TPA: 4-(cytidine 5'-diphospho)-2-C-methyl-D-erythritol kinase [Flavisolibacter sp.]|nr:4-(cytidine 5'-diphospho)-2-C-methyl-D-erythritol kinase [Flavisolibacter sp.]
MIVFPNCKINLGLHILRKRADGFHDLETIFYPIALQDALEVVQNSSPSPDIQLTTSGLKIDSSNEENICFKAYLLLKKDFPKLVSIKMHLHKVIPSGAGLGGGSSDGAFTLTLLNKKFNLGLNEDQLIEYALKLGSDCPFFIKNKPCYATGRGEKMEDVELSLSNYKILLVNPGIHVHTGKAFSKIIPSDKRTSIKEIIQQPIEQWKDVLKNDFEEIVFADHPEIKVIKETLYQKGALYASMSGSGSSVYGIINKDTQLQFDFPSHYFLKII